MGAPRNLPVLQAGFELTDSGGKTSSSHDVGSLLRDLFQVSESIMCVEIWVHIRVKERHPCVRIRGFSPVRADTGVLGKSCHDCTVGGDSWWSTEYPKSFGNQNALASF